MLFSISQHSLHDISLRFRDRQTPGASLFPLFDGEGQTRALMLTDTGGTRIRLLRYDPQRMKARLFLPRLWPQRLHHHHTDLRDASEDDALDVAHLWHFDPWWELGEKRYGDHPAVPILKTTNIPGYDPTLARVWFDATLRRVTWVGYGEGEAMRVERFRPQSLATARQQRRATEEVRPATLPPGEWRLRPFWNRS